MRDFAQRRPTRVRGFFNAQFGLPGSARLNLDAGTGGRVLAYGVPMPRGASGPVFFREVPLNLVAVPDEGYVFTGWQGLVATASDSISVVLTGETTLTATFAPDNNPTSHETTPNRIASRLGPNHPNPFTTQTQFDVVLGATGHVTVRIHDLLGREVATVLDAIRPAGTHRLTFDAHALPSGIYLYTMTTAEQTFTQQMVLVR